MFQQKSVGHGFESRQLHHMGLWLSGRAPDSYCEKEPPSKTEALSLYGVKGGTQISHDPTFPKTPSRNPRTNNNLRSE